MEAHATSQGSLTWLQGWLSSMGDAGPRKAEGPDVSSGKLEQGLFQDRPCVTGAPGHTLCPVRTVSRKLCAHQEPFQC